MHVLTLDRLLLTRRTSLIMEQSQVSNHLLVGGLEVSHHFTVERALSSMTHLLARQSTIDLQIAKVLMSGTRVR